MFFPRCTCVECSSRKISRTWCPSICHSYEESSTRMTFPWTSPEKRSSNTSCSRSSRRSLSARRSTWSRRSRERTTTSSGRNTAQSESLDTLQDFIQQALCHGYMMAIQWFRSDKYRCINFLSSSTIKKIKIKCKFWVILTKMAKRATEAIYWLYSWLKQSMDSLFKYTVTIIFTL